MTINFIISFIAGIHPCAKKRKAVILVMIIIRQNQKCSSFTLSTTIRFDSMTRVYMTLYRCFETFSPTCESLFSENSKIAREKCDFCKIFFKYGLSKASIDFFPDRQDSENGWILAASWQKTALLMFYL